MTKFFSVISGSREWTDTILMAKVLRDIPDDTLFVHGECAGADRHAAKILAGRCYEVRVPYPSRLSYAGGPMRNRLMIEMAMVYKNAGYDVCVYAFPMPKSKSKSSGTYNLIEHAQFAGLCPLVTEM